MVWSGSAGSNSLLSFEKCLQALGFWVYFAPTSLSLLETWKFIQTNPIFCQSYPPTRANRLDRPCECSLLPFGEPPQSRPCRDPLPVHLQKWRWSWCEVQERYLSDFTSLSLHSFENTRKQQTSIILPDGVGVIFKPPGGIF